ncbi:VOC family protein [Pontibacter ruber]|uniref:VOC family protein n=1 Tax=Pontibacter ruber TaxID=1343895 RepID=A0ABW5D1C6_9BACT|nr:VOC family protein [Pontibacter ruber]
MSDQNNKLLQGIDTVIVRVSDVSIASNWYQEKLGLAVVWDDPSSKLVVLDTNGPTSLTLWQTNQKQSINKETASYPIFRTPDAAVLKEALQARGVTAEELVRDEYVTYFFFYDPDGNILEACQVHE